MDSNSKIHVLHELLSTRAHPIGINVIGAGGNGAFFLQELARIAWAYEQLFNNSIVVTCYDGDKVETSNLGRQLFFDSDVGLNKANVMITRINLTYGFDWQSVPKFWHANDNLDCNIVVGCVDNVKTRKEIVDGFDNHKLKGYNNNEYERPLYYLDIGNMFNYGQVILGNNKNYLSDNCEYARIMHFGEYFDIKKMKDDKTIPSCGVAESLSKQDLFVNRIAATLGAAILWDLLRNEMIDYHGYIFNMEAGRVAKIMI